MVSPKTSKKVVLPEVAKVQQALGRAVQARRKAKGLSQEEFADSIGRSADLVSSLERGLTFTSMETLVKIAALFECPVVELFGSGHPTRYPDNIQSIVDLLSDQPSSVREAAEQQIRILIKAATTARSG